MLDFTAGCLTRSEPCSRRRVATTLGLIVVVTVLGDRAEHRGGGGTAQPPPSGAPAR